MTVSTSDPLHDFMSRHLPALADVPIIGPIFVAIVIAIVGWLASRWLRGLTGRALTARKFDPALSRSLVGVVRWTVLTATLIVALDALGFKTTSMLTIVASAGLAVGLALQGTLTNFASGVLLLVFRPFTIGHKVAVGGNVGVVTDLSLFFTTILTPENKTVSVQNSAVTGATIVNFTKEGTLRAFVDVGVPGTADVVSTTALLLKAATEAQHVRAEPAPEVAFNGLASNSLQFTVSVWGTAGDYLPMLEAVQRALLAALSTNGADLASAKIVPRAA